MPPLPDREALQKLKRVDLQKLCKVVYYLFHIATAILLTALKDYGVKANLKSDALIDLLLDTKCVHHRFPQTLT